MKLFKPALPVFLLLMITIAVQAQRMDSLGNKISLYGIKKQSPVLFLHFDKNVYASNEQVWFTGYLLNADESYKTLSVALAKDNSRRLIAEDKFVIGNSVVFGNMLIPDSILAGAYTLIATTNRLKNGQPAVVFTQPIIIKTMGQSPLTISLDTAQPAPVRPATVNFYPEGGNMINNLQGIVGIEVKNAAGAPLGVSAVLYRNNQPIDTIATSSDGLGKFALKPRLGSSYYIKLHNVNKQDTLYRLPPIIMRGPALALQNAVVNDTLIVDLHDEQYEKLYLVGHNYRELLFITPVTMTATRKRITFIIKDIPKGLTQLTLTDSLGQPFAQRLFFAHYSRKTPVNITTGNEEYAIRQKVNVKIKLHTSIPDSGFVSVACVQENRLEIKNKNDIESYLYLKNNLGDIPVRETYLGGTAADKQFMENILLIKGWRRYKWTDVLRSQPDDTIPMMENLLFKGTVMKFNKPIKKQVELVMMEKIKVLPTDATGNYTLYDTDMITAQDKKFTLIVNNEYPHDYTIQLTDPYTTVNKTLALQLQPKDYGPQQNTNDMQVPLNERAVQLKEVKITANNDGSFWGKARGSNICGDYVCGNNILNCQYHRNDFENRPAVPGKTYITKGTLQYYSACAIPKKTTYMPSFKGIYEAQEFYPADYSEIGPTLPEHLSTLYWKYLVKVSSLKDAELSFYTGDITGRFKIIVQGITGNDVTYGETSFNVVKP